MHKESIGLQQETLGLQKEIISLQKETLGLQKETLELQKETISLQTETVSLQKETLQGNQRYQNQTFDEASIPNFVRCVKNSEKKFEIPSLDKICKP